MRIRKKKWARQELEEAIFYTDNPQELKDRWSERFGNNNEIHVELGCGKGQFISQLSFNNPNVNYVAIDLIDAMLGLAKRNIENIYTKENNSNDFKNIVLTRYNVEQIDNVFGQMDNVKRIYINFCNPWPRGKHKKRRLTHTRQLEKYKQFLDGEIYFKTDDDELFEESLEYFNNSGFEIVSKTYDLENEDIFGGNIETEHEKMFKTQGIKIKGVIARWKK